MMTVNPPPMIFLSSNAKSKEKTELPDFGTNALVATLGAGKCQLGTQKSKLRWYEITPGSFEVELELELLEIEELPTRLSTTIDIVRFPVSDEYSTLLNRSQRTSSCWSYA